jgi:hypothetical protein
VRLLPEYRRASACVEVLPGLTRSEVSGGARTITRADASSSSSRGSAGRVSRVREQQLTALGSGPAEYEVPPQGGKQRPSRHHGGLPRTGWCRAAGGAGRPGP